MEKFTRLVVVAPTRSTCLNISLVLQNGTIPPTLLIQEKGEEIFGAVEKLDQGGFGVVAGTGTGKTVAIRDIASRVLREKLTVDVVTREHEATDYTWTCNVLVITPGVALHWFKSHILTAEDLVVIDEIHQTSEHLELSIALAKRAGCKFIWMSATIDPRLYSEYLSARDVILCSAYDPSKKSQVICSNENCSTFLSGNVERFIQEQRATAVFVPTRAMAEQLSRSFSEMFTEQGLYCDFYHGGESTEKLRQFLKGEVPKPFMIFMTTAGASSLNILGLNTVVIVDEIYTNVIHSGVPVLERVHLDNNTLLQMGGRVNGRMIGSEIHILTNRSVDFHSLRPTTPSFVLGGDLRRVALTCARLDINLSDLDIIGQINHEKYAREVARFKERGVIEQDGDSLTAYGKAVERLPVEPHWAEMLVHAGEGNDDHLLNTVVVCACTESLYSLISRDADLEECSVSESDHLTSHNIVVTALRQFAYVRADEGDVGYKFRGDWVKKQYDKYTRQTITEKGQFIEWCDENGFRAKAIKEVAIAMKSVYRQLGMDLPKPENLWFIESGDQVHKDFVDVLARTQSLDYVHDERNSQAGTVWAAQCSMTSTESILGVVRHWTDKKGYQRATIEGTEIPDDLVRKYALKELTGIVTMTSDGNAYVCRFVVMFAGERMEEMWENVAIDDIPPCFSKKGKDVFADWLAGQMLA